MLTSILFPFLLTGSTSPSHHGSAAGAPAAAGAQGSLSAALGYAGGLYEHEVEAVMLGTDRDARDAADFLRALLRYEPDARVSARRALDLPWLADGGDLVL